MFRRIPKFICLTLIIFLYFYGNDINAQRVYDLEAVKNSSYQIFLDKETGEKYDIKQVDSFFDKIEVNIFGVTIREDTAVFNITLGSLEFEKNPRDYINKPLKFNLTDFKGNSFDSLSLRGKIVVLNFWFTSCRPCIEEIPFLNYLAEQFKEEEIVFLAPTHESPDVIAEFLSNRTFEYNVIHNSSEFINQLDIHVFPTHMILDRHGILRWIGSGNLKNPNTGIVEINKILEMEIRKYL